MAITSINIGTAPTGSDGDTLREAFTKVNDNFADILPRDADIVPVGTSRNLLASDSGKVLMVSGTVTLTIPTGLDTGFRCSVLNKGSGVVDFAAGSGASLSPSSVELENTGYQTVSAANVIHEGGGTYYVLAGTIPQEAWMVPLSDESTALSTGTGVMSIRMPYDFQIVDLITNVNTAPTGSTILVDVNDDGTSIFSTRVSIDASETNSTTAATPYVLSGSGLVAAGSVVSFDIDQVGSTTAGNGLKITMLGHQV